MSEDDSLFDESAESQSVFDDEPMGELSGEGEEVGMTSDEASDDTDSADEAAKKDKFTLNLYDAMLMISLVCITLATLFLVFELRTFGDFPGGFPWRTSELNTLMF
jgi:hypothetical protein